MSLKLSGSPGVDFGTGEITQPVGVVSQVAGVPTGAIMESGSNANGNYIKFADGTLVCWISDKPGIYGLRNSVGGGVLFSNGDETWNFPATFVGPLPSVHVSLRRGIPYAWICNSYLAAPTISQARWCAASAQGTDTVPVFDAMAIGRWF